MRKIRVRNGVKELSDWPLLAPPLVQQLVPQLGQPLALVVALEVERGVEQPAAASAEMQVVEMMVVEMQVAALGVDHPQEAATVMQVAVAAV